MSQKIWADITMIWKEQKELNIYQVPQMYLYRQMHLIRIILSIIWPHTEKKCGVWLILHDSH
jgi:hypothetical protein